MERLFYLLQHVWEHPSRADPRQPAYASLARCWGGLRRYLCREIRPARRIVPIDVIANLLQVACRPNRGRQPAFRAERVAPLEIGPSKPDLRVGISRSQRVHPGEAKLAGTVYAPIGSFLFAFDDGEGRVDIADVVAVSDAVEMEEHGVQLGAQM